MGRNLLNELDLHLHPLPPTAEQPKDDPKGKGKAPAASTSEQPADADKEKEKALDVVAELVVPPRTPEEQAEVDARIEGLAKLTKGYGGADLRALCTEYVISSCSFEFVCVTDWVCVCI